ncbi:MAG: hypothetical protein ACTS6G_00095 [Candidatus Hodgkinia cicadicola]
MINNSCLRPQASVNNRGSNYFRTNYLTCGHKWSWLLRKLNFQNSLQPTITY